MLRPKNILMPTDFSEHANQALRFAVMLAEKFASELTLLHVVTLFEHDPNNPGHHFPDLADFYRKMELDAHRRLDELHRLHERVQIHRVSVKGISAAAEILSYHKNNPADLIVMGTHGRAALGHFLLGSVAERIVRHADCPVLTVAHQEKHIYERPDMRHILVPIDFSEPAKRAVVAASRIAAQFNATLSFLYVVDQRLYPTYGIAGVDSLLHIYNDLLDKSLNSLHEFVEKLIDPNPSHRFAVREGNPHTEIVRFAKAEACDMIIMATHGMSGWEKVLIGSTTERVIRKAVCPVLSVKAFAN